MKCFYVPGSRSIIDTVTDQGISAIEGETLEQIRQRYPEAELWDLGEACEKIQELTYKALITAPKEITIERWDEMLGILPPMKWRSGRGTESFMICEATALDIHSIFCRIGNRHFEMTNRRTMTHEEIVSACLESIG